MRRWTVIVLLATTIYSLSGGGVFASDKEKIDPQQRSPSERHWQIGFTPSFSSGNFGTNTTSTFVHAPVSIRRLFQDGDVTVVIPFVSVTSNGAATLVGGQPTPALGGGCFRNGGTEFRFDKPECVASLNAGQGVTTGQKVTNSGLGDIILRGRYYLVEERDYVPLIALTARMKLPTANASQGLGTGAFDHGYGVELSKLFGEKWIGFLDGGYNFIGDPDGRELRNQYWFDVGGGYYVSKRFLVSAYYEEYRSLVADVSNIRDVFFAFHFKASDAWRFNGGVTVGLSDSAPDYAVSLGSSYRF